MSLYEKCPDPPPKTPAEPVLLPEAFRVCALYGLAGTGIYMVFYFLRLVVFLSSVEELPVAYQKADSDTRLGPIALPDDEDSRWAIPPPLRRVSRGAIAREFIASKLYGAFSIGRELFLYGPNDNGLVTASLSTCVAQLRYMSGQSFWMLRAAGTHVIWWVCVRRFLVGVCGTGLWVIIYFPVWLSGADSKSPFVCDTILCSTTILSDLLVSIWMRGNFVDHSLRVLAVSTGWGKKVALSTWDASHLRRADKEDPVLPIAIHIICRNVAYLIPHIMLRKHLPMNFILYIGGADPAEIFQDPTVRSAILHTGITWAGLALVLVVPSLVLVARSHAQELSRTEASIVGYARITGSRGNLWPTFSGLGCIRLRLTAHHMVRVFRMVFHAGMAMILFLILVSAALWPALNRSAMRDEIKTLLRGAYILGGPTVNGPLMVVTVTAPVVFPIWAFVVSTKIIYNQAVPE